jgi:hypothetical protein
MQPINNKGTVTTATNHTTLHKQDVAASAYVPLTPEGLLIFCQSQLLALDTTIQKNMAGQQGLVALQQKVTEIQTKLKSYAKGGAEDEARINNQPTVDEIAASIDSAIADATACGDTSLAKSLVDVKATLEGGNDALVVESELKDMNAMLDSALSTCRTGAEMRMIELQGSISKRATGLQLITNMLNSVNESLKSIASNTGRV